MRFNELKSVVHDLVHVLEDFSPMIHVFIREKLEVNLLTGRISYPEKDDLFEFYKKKAEWFKERIKKLDGNLKDFEEAKIRVFGHKEKVMVKYKNKILEGEILFNKKSPASYGSYEVEDWFNWKDN